MSRSHQPRRRVHPGELVAYDSIEQTLVFALPVSEEAPDDPEGEEPDDQEASTATEPEEEPSEPPAEGKEPATRVLPVDQVASVFFAMPAADEAEEAASGGVTFVFRDGSRLSGRALSVQGASLRLASAALEGQIEFPMSAIAEVQSRLDGRQEPGDPTPETPVLRTDSSRVRGRISEWAATDSASCLAWRPVGSNNALPLLHGVRGKLILRPTREETVSTPARAKPQRPAQNGFLGAVFGLFGGKQNAGRASETALQTMRGLGYASSVYLRGGDLVPCRVRGIGPEGLAIESRFISNDTIAPEHIKAIELKSAGVDGKMTPTRRDRLLTLPRMQQDDPPTHLLVSSRGDYLRCRLIRLDDRYATVEVHLEERQIERSRIARIIWLDPPGEEGSASESIKDPDGPDRLQVQA